MLRVTPSSGTIFSAEVLLLTHVQLLDDDCSIREDVAAQLRLLHPAVSCTHHVVHVRSAVDFPASSQSCRHRGDFNLRRPHLATAECIFQFPFHLIERDSKCSEHAQLWLPKVRHVHVAVNPSPALQPVRRRAAQLKTRRSWLNDVKRASAACFPRRDRLRGSRR